MFMFFFGEMFGTAGFGVRGVAWVVLAAAPVVPVAVPRRPPAPPGRFF